MFSIFHRYSMFFPSGFPLLSERFSFLKKHSTMLTFYCQNKVEYLQEALESCRHQIWFLFQNLILSCQETFLIGYNLSFLINGGKTLVTCIEECNTKYHRLSNDTTPTFCAYYFLDIKTIKMNLQSPWQ